jgi:VIT1/CCC1 family predicted Fe2+/Mn2+ transporter
MEKLLKIISNVLAFIGLLTLFFLALTYKEQLFPFLLGFEGALIILLVLLTIENKKKGWKAFITICSIGLLFIFYAGWILSEIHEAPRWLTEICQFGTSLTLILSVCMLCTIAFTKIFLKNKKF